MELGLGQQVVLPHGDHAPVWPGARHLGDVRDSSEVSAARQLLQLRSALISNTAAVPPAGAAADRGEAAVPPPGGAVGAGAEAAAAARGGAEPGPGPEAGGGQAEGEAGLGGQCGQRADLLPSLPGQRGHAS